MEGWKDPNIGKVVADYDKVLRQRNALLRGGMRDEHARSTLPVFDEQLVTAGAELLRGERMFHPPRMPASRRGEQAVRPIFYSWSGRVWCKPLILL